MEALVNFWTDQPLILTIAIALLLSYGLTWVLRLAIGRAMYKLAFKIGNKYYDLLIDRLRPFRFVWFVPLLIIWYVPWVVSGEREVVNTTVEVLMLWVGVDLVIRLLEYINDVNRHRRYYRGVSIAGYIDLLKLVAVILAIIITVRSFWDISNEVLLGGIGAYLAVFMIIFKDTLLSFVASIQITTRDLIKEGDWIEIPSLGINGIVNEISLQTIKVRNWDNSISPIATHKISELSYKNWRGMRESGGRQMIIKIPIDQRSIQMADSQLISTLGDNRDLGSAFMKKLEELTGAAGADLKRSMTNIQLYLWFVQGYLEERPDLHQRRMIRWVRLKNPSPHGLPVQLCAFTKAVDLIDHEAVKGEILSYLMASLALFNLRVYQLEGHGGESHGE
ncbi:MAG: mechanosensitive ion channel family protein [Planctomycetota bacterium]|jgi:miniconductance mechanosensitive channel